METWRAFAKVNRSLRVLGSRQDGYHEVRTVMQTLDLCDEIRVSPAGRFQFTTDRGPSDDSNLVVRAVRAFEKETAIAVQRHVHLAKRIPIGGGLGGGSADAAVTLCGLCRSYGVRIPGERLGALLRGLGSDVAFFALGGRALATGRGDRLFPLPDADPVWFLLVSPDLEIVTGEAYSWLTETYEPSTILGFCAWFVTPHAHASHPPDGRLNDFEGPVMRRFPELAEIKGKLSEAGARCAMLTGTGATVFGEFSEEQEVRRAAEFLGASYPVTVARSLGRAEYFQRMFT